MALRFLRYVTDWFFWLLPEMNGFGLAILGIAQTKMIF